MNPAQLCSYFTLFVASILIYSIYNFNQQQKRNIVLYILTISSLIIIILLNNRAAIVSLIATSIFILYSITRIRKRYLIIIVLLGICAFIFLFFYFSQNMNLLLAEFSYGKFVVCFYQMI